MKPFAYFSLLGFLLLFALFVSAVERGGKSTGPRPQSEVDAEREMRLTELEAREAERRQADYRQKQEKERTEAQAQWDKLMEDANREAELRRREDEAYRRGLLDGEGTGETKRRFR